ncbi:MAG: methylenetetrahydrofolate reductase, partial [Coleofasciculaceae cyanobacterium SM2_3_26]|nr:methylenetetrahydrofolate reductase [Coleofasciculaceae cyanobacterium SM2_3_26]
MTKILTRFREAVKSGEFLITAEVAPPKGGNADEALKMAQTLNNRVHAVNLTDGSRAVMRMSSLAMSAILLQHGIEPICQVACRDRNRIGLQADLLGAHALGIRNILALTGDPVKAGDHKDARSVFDLESVRLLHLIGKLNRGVDANDKPLTDGATNLFVGAAVDPELPSWSSLQRRFERKLAAGAQFFQSQLISNFDRLDKFMTQIAAGSDKPILAGIFLLKSAKNARFIKNMVPGVHITDETIERLEKAKDPLYEGMAIAAEQVRHAREICQGVHMMAIKREDLIPQILDMAGIDPIPPVSGSNLSNSEVAS